MTDKRTVLRVEDDGSWTALSSILDVKKGDVIKLLEDGVPIKYKDSTYLLATSDGFINDANVGTVEVDAYFK